MYIVPRVNLLPEEFRPYILVKKNGSSQFVTPPIVYFLTKTDKYGPIWNGTHCWNWLGSISPLGYPSIGKRSGISRSHAHTWYWEQVNGSVPQGRELDHLCRNRRCVNPIHLEPVTHRVNCLRSNSPCAANSRKTHCSRGHPLSGENLKVYVGPTKTWRKCLQCISAWNRKEILPAAKTLQETK